MIEQTLQLFILGLLISMTIIVAWFFTSFPVHLTNLVSMGRSKHSYGNWAEWLSWVRSKSELAAELLGCPICLGFWVSLSVAAMIAIVNGLTMWFIPSGALGWPVVIFAAFKRLSR